MLSPDMSINKTFLAASVAALVLTGAGCFGPQTPKEPAPVELNYWRTEDDSAALDPAIAAYRKLHPHVTVKAITLRSEEYEQKLLEALAEDRGPDMFSIPNTWYHAWQSKLLPVPKEITVATRAVDADKNIVTVNRKVPGLSLLTLRNQFVEGAANDAVMSAPAEKEGGSPVDKIFGLPLSFDTLALFYNKDLMRKAGFDEPPASWRDLQDMAAKMTVLNEDDVILTSGAAIGGTNVRYAADILAVIMAQGGATIADTYGYANFNVVGAGTNRSATPAIDALYFYQGFTDPRSATFTWDEFMPESRQAFISGRAAFYFGYPDDVAAIRSGAPRLDFGLAPLPQIDPSRPKNIARYRLEVVSQKTRHPNEAWDFLTFLASKDGVADWLEKTKRPTALRSLIAPQLTDPAIAPFATQILTGRSWYRGNDWSKVEEAFDYMIRFRPTTRQNSYQTVLNQAVGMINSTY